MAYLRENVDVAMENISSVLSPELEKIKDTSDENSSPSAGVAKPGQRRRT